MKLEEKPSYEEFISLTKNGCVVFEFLVPKKEGDPGCVNVPSNLGDVYVSEALCDLGASGNLCWNKIRLSNITLRVGEFGRTKMFNIWHS